MTDTPDDLLKTDATKQVDEYIRSLVKCARALPQKEWRWGQFTRPDGSPIETIDHVCEAQEKSARMSDKAELWGVDLGVDAPVVCYTGNGPCSKDHAQYIAAVRPEIIIWILDNLGERIEALESRQRVLREALETIRDRHIPDQPMADDCDEAEYARSQHTALRVIAIRALAGDAP